MAWIRDQTLIPDVGLIHRGERVLPVLWEQELAASICLSSQCKALEPVLEVDRCHCDLDLLQLPLLLPLTPIQLGL